MADIFFRARKLTNSWITRRGTSQVAVKRKPAVNFMIVFRRMLVQGGKFCVRSMLMKGSAEQLIGVLQSSEGTAADKGMNDQGAVL